MTDNTIPQQLQCQSCLGPLALDGNCYNPGCVSQQTIATDNSMDLQDAVRALKDRPSLEAELSALRAKCERLEGVFRGIACLEADEEEILALKCEECIETVFIARKALNEKGAA